MKKPKGYQRGGKTGGMMRKVPKGMANGGKRGGTMTLAAIRAAAKAKGYKLVKMA